MALSPNEKKYGNAQKYISFIINIKIRIQFIEEEKKNVVFQELLLCSLFKRDLCGRVFALE